MTKLKDMSFPGAHDHIFSIMDKMPRGAVLDAPAGSGALSTRLQDAGFSVSCCDIDSGNFYNSDRLDLKNADFNCDKLPYDDGSFDYIVCANGLHRLYHPQNIIGEFSRVLKDNGTLVLSWPNYNSLSRRLGFLLRGTIGGSIDRAQYDQTITEPGAQVRFPLSADRMSYLLDKRGIEMESIQTTDKRPYEYLLSPISLVISLLGKALGFSSADNQLEVILGGSTTITLAKKRQSHAAAAS